jgi:hypothetical protein
MLFWRIILLSVMLGWVPAPTLAEGDDSAGSSRPEWAEDGRNELALVVGATRTPSDSGPSLGLDFGHRFTRLFGLGGTIEWTGADIRDGVVAIVFDFHVWKELKFFVAPGIEIETVEKGDEPFLRLGIEYGFDIGKKWAVAPAVNYDFTSSENAIVLAVGFGKSF